MDPKKKKIYIVIIVVCVVFSAGLLFWSQTDFTSLQEHPTPINVNTSASGPSGDYLSGFSAPSVFPATDKFNTQVLDSTNFKDLSPYTPLNVTGQLGRPDPFKNY